MLNKTKKMIVAITLGVLALGNDTIMAEEKTDSGKEATTQETMDTGYSDEKIVIEEVNIEKEGTTLLSEEYNISVKESIKVKDTSVPLYCTFDSQEEALNKISENQVIQLIKEKYGYEDISNLSWKKYYDAMYEMLDNPDSPDWYCEGNEDFRKLRQFFDIYENEEKNEEIKSLIRTDMCTTDVIQKTDLIYLLPYESSAILSHQSNVLNNVENSTFSIVNGFDVDSGVSYATAHATSPNTSDYDQFSSDCTNFVSQILENGGVSQAVYSNENSGWWHKKTKTLFGTKHTHSISWIRADTFAHYMGVTYTTANHSAFTCNIQRGDFIAADFDNDGDWDHMGFVTERNNSPTDGYYNYKVAQHTNNYHAWASSSTNNWDTIGSDGGIYGRVRR